MNMNKLGWLMFDLVNVGWFVLGIVFSTTNKKTTKLRCIMCKTRMAINLCFVLYIKPNMKRTERKGYED